MASAGSSLAHPSGPQSMPARQKHAASGRAGFEIVRSFCWRYRDPKPFAYGHAEQASSPRAGIRRQMVEVPPARVHCALRTTGFHEGPRPWHRVLAIGKPRTQPRSYRLPFLSGKAICQEINPSLCDQNRYSRPIDSANANVHPDPLRVIGDRAARIAGFSTSSCGMPLRMPTSPGPSPKRLVFSALITALVQDG